MEIRGKSLANLVCGNLSSQFASSDLIQIQTALQKKLVLFTSKLLSCKFNTDGARLVAPFYARNILETTATALLARIDPFRVIIAFKVQNDSSYDMNTPSYVAINWKKDIFAEPSPPARGLWHFENKASDFNRALLSKFQGEIIWKPAFLQLVDYLDSHPIQSPWIDEMLALDETQYFEQSRSNAQHLFSSFSKGVHAESLIDVDVSFIYDEITLKTYSVDLLKWCYMIGLISNFSSYALLSQPPQFAISQFRQAERMVINALR